MIIEFKGVLGKIESGISREKKEPYNVASIMDGEGEFYKVFLKPEVAVQLAGIRNVLVKFKGRIYGQDGSPKLVCDLLEVIK